MIVETLAVAWLFGRVPLDAGRILEIDRLVQAEIRAQHREIRVAQPASKLSPEEEAGERAAAALKLVTVL